VVLWHSFLFLGLSFFPLVLFFLLGSLYYLDMYSNIAFATRFVGKK
jgi:hypothetical protein